MTQSLKTPADEAGILGRGWAFPPRFDRNTASVAMLSGVEDIESSLHILFSTEAGERVMQLDYGASLRQLLFDNLDASTSAYLKEMVRRAIVYHEPRIQLQDLQFAAYPEEGRVDIVLAYSVRATNARHNHVFPFFHEEGTNLKP